MTESKVLPTMFVCDGCCCGRTEKGHNEVPVSRLKIAWKKEKLDKDGGPEGDIVQGEGYVVTDRNSLLEKLKNMDK